MCVADARRAPAAGKEVAAEFPGLLPHARVWHRVPAMSHAHPTMRAWARDEPDGSYSCEMHGYRLRVSWAPNRPGARGSFSWEATRAGSKPVRSEEHFEEMAEAMSDAEAFARRGAADRTAELATKTAFHG